MTGRTNAGAGGKTELELIWTNPNPSQSLASPFTLTTNYDCLGFVIDAKRTSSSSDDVCARNYVGVGTTNQMLVGLSSPDFTYCNRNATAQARTITLTAINASFLDRTVPLRIYAIKA